LGRHAAWADERLVIRAMLRTGQPAAAHARLAAVDDGGRLGLLPIDLLPELLAAVRARRGAAAADRVLDRLEQRRPVRIELRLSAEFERRVDRYRTAVADPDAPLPRFAPSERAIAERLGPPEPGERPATSAIRRCCAALAAIRARHAVFHPDAVTSLPDALAVADRLAAAIERRSPLSLIRLGDGEGNFLPYAPDLERHRRADQDSIQRIWWSTGLVADDEAAQLERVLAEAIRAADIVGIPDLYRMCRAFRQDLPYNQTSRGALAVIEQFAGAAPPPGGVAVSRPDQIVTGAHVHNAFAYWRLWDLLLPPLGRCALIAGHADAGEAIRGRFGVAVARLHLVPGERKYRAPAAAAEEAAHFPARFEELRSALRDVGPGEVFLVAAGILGKIYCAWIQARGGIAIDVGSALDHWRGQATRTAFEATYFTPPPGLLAAYAARPGLDRDYPHLRPAARAAALLERRRAPAPA
ncbi:MAG: hypothetical protein AB7O45_12000, partial [Alphaproteobacteria bacterium]